MDVAEYFDMWTKPKVPEYFRQYGDVCVLCADRLFSQAAVTLVATLLSNLRLEYIPDQSRLLHLTEQYLKAVQNMDSVGVHIQVSSDYVYNMTEVHREGKDPFFFLIYRIVLLQQF